MKAPHKWMSEAHRSNHSRFLQPIIMIVYWFGFALLLAPVFLIGFALGAIRNLNEAIIPDIALSAIPAWWFSRISAHYIAFEDQTFRVVFQATFYPVFVKLAFLPVIGSYFERFVSKERSQNPFVNEEAENEKSAS